MDDSALVALRDQGKGVLLGDVVRDGKVSAVYVGYGLPFAMARSSRMEAHMLHVIWLVMVVALVAGILLYELHIDPPA